MVVARLVVAVCINLLLSPNTVGDDYTVTARELEFQPSDDPIVCINAIMLEQDLLLERTESFFLLLESSDESVVIHPDFSRLTVEIEDINSKLMGQSLSHLIYLSIQIAAVQIGFQDVTYVGMESLGMITVCAVINNGIILDRPVSVELRTVLDGSADGK